MTPHTAPRTDWPPLLTVEDWSLDWSIVGAVTAFVVPAVPLGMPMLFGAGKLEGLIYCAMCAMLGIPTGALVGAALWAIRRQLPLRSYRAAALVLLPLGLGLWGALVASAGVYLALTSPSEMVLLAWPLGTIAAVLQTVWLAPSYPWWSRDPGRRNALRFVVLPLASIVLGVLVPFLGLPVLIGAGVLN
ncbi:MAG: hypothetical protein AAF211_16890 [Myxococcota bacterium]